LVERPRLEGPRTVTTSSTTFEEILRLQLNPDILGISYLSMSIDPDPNARYRIMIGRLLRVEDEELTAIWSLVLPHLTQGFYKGLHAGDFIRIAHRSTNPAVTVKTSYALALNEVVLR
jgi:hypothetical protein